MTRCKARRCSSACACVVYRSTFVIECICIVDEHCTRMYQEYSCTIRVWISIMICRFAIGPRQADRAWLHFVVVGRDPQFHEVTPSYILRADELHVVALVDVVLRTPLSTAHTIALYVVVSIMVRHISHWATPPRGHATHMPYPYVPLRDTKLFVSISYNVS